MKLWLIAWAVGALLTVATPAYAGLPPYADDGGSGFYTQVGDRCEVAGAITTGWNPTIGQVVTLQCQCSPGIGDVCLWVQISYAYRVWKP